MLEWYAENGRDLAFRHTSDPWAILVSEVIAQQTQAARAAEAWTRFIAEFPTPHALAAASPASAIRAWRGLGYNRRALALRAAAIAIVKEHAGQVPRTLDALMALPGVGPYTARAVLAIAYNESVAALDVNIRRVLRRAFIGEDVPPRALQSIADTMVPNGQAATWTHAVMDIGAAFCRPREPRCTACPLQAVCRFAQGGREPRVRAAAAGAPRQRKAPRFESTTRWLRGRILDRLRDAPDGAWVAFEEEIGGHGRTAVRAAVAALASEGLIEGSGARARLAST